MDAYAIILINKTEVHASWPLVGCALLGVWPSRHIQRRNRLFFLLVWGKLTHFWNSFSGFVFVSLFFLPPGLVWIFLAVLTVLKSPTITLRISMKTSGKTLAIVTSTASGKKPKKLVDFFSLTLQKHSSISSERVSKCFCLCVMGVLPRLVIFFAVDPTLL